MSPIGRAIKDPFSGISHAVGALLSIVGLFILLGIAAGRPAMMLACAVYGTSLVILFTASALTHSIRASPEVEMRLDRFDYAAIYLLIAGTYTPFCVGPLRGHGGWALLAAEWGLALAGVVSALFMTGRAGWIRITVYVVMGWLGFLSAGTLWHALPVPLIVWLVLGGVIYSLGAIVFALNRPRLWPGRFGAHDLWHVMVLVGSACHFVVIACFVAKFSASLPP